MRLWVSAGVWKGVVCSQMCTGVGQCRLSLHCFGCLGDSGRNAYNRYPKSQLHCIPQPSCKPLEYSTLCVNNMCERLITPLNRWFSVLQNTIRCFDLYRAQIDAIYTEPTYVDSTTFSTCETQPLNAYTTHIVYSTPSSPLGSPRLTRKSLIRPC
jgi:hypothetical protein